MRARPREQTSEAAPAPRALGAASKRRCGQPVAELQAQPATHDPSRARGLEHADERHFQLFIERAYDAILVADPDARIRYANPAATRIYGYSEAELLGMCIPDLIDTSPSSQAAAGEHFGRVTEHGESRGEVLGLRKDGSLVWTDVNAVAIGGGRFLGTIRDTTERRAYEDALRLTAAVFEATSEAILVTDAAGTIVRVNRAFTELTGFAPEEAVGHSPRILRSGRHGPEFYAEMWKVLNRDGSWSGEICNRTKCGRLYTESLSINAVCDGDGKPTEYVALFSDITRRKGAEERLAHLAHHDPLTGLANRRLLSERLAESFARARRQGGRVAVLFIDLDDFKTINDTLGHDVGDELIQGVAKRLLEVTRETDTVARLGGDEFILLVDGCTGHAAAAAAARRALRSLRPAFRLAGREVFVSGSVGIALFPDDAETAGDILRHADAAMYRAKALGRNTWQFYRAEMNSWAHERLDWESGMRGALEHGEYQLHYQPILRVGDRRPVRAEALLRWQHPSQGLIAPGSFIELAEEMGIITMIDRWVVREACRQLGVWRNAGIRDLTIAVNLSARQFRDSEFATLVEEALAENRILGNRLELEITEGALLLDDDRIRRTVDDLHHLGVRVVIDDFGTGYSALSYLHRFSIDGLKIDRSFVSGLETAGHHAGIIHAIVAMAGHLKLEVTAEGVETEAQRQFLEAAGCTSLQGFLFSRPVPAGDLPGVLARWPGRKTE